MSVLNSEIKFIYIYLLPFTINLLNKIIQITKWFNVYILYFRVRAETEQTAC